MLRYTLIIIALALAGCGKTPIYRDRVVEVRVPVSVPCVTDRPAEVVPLKDKTPDWAALDVRQKAALVGKQGLERQAYGEQLRAATGACPVIDD